MSRVIKSGDFRPVNFQVLERHILLEEILEVNEPDPEDTAQALLHRAQTEAEVIVRTARAEAEDILRTARESGHLEGYQCGKAEARAEAEAKLTPLIQRLEDDIAAFEADTRVFLESLEPELLKLCFESVEKVIRREVKTDPRVVIRVIKACLRRVKNSHDVRVRVNPAEVAAVRAVRDELLGLAEGVDAVNIVDDRRVSAGGCIIETANGDLDATVETQLGRIEKTFTETYENDRNKTCPEPGEVSEGNQPDGHDTD